MVGISASEHARGDVQLWARNTARKTRVTSADHRNMTARLNFRLGSIAAGVARAQDAKETNLRSGHQEKGK